MYVSPEIIRKLDELVRLDLQRLRDWYFLLLEISTGLVLFGVMLEGPEVVTDSLDFLHKRGWLKSSQPDTKEWWPTPPERHRDWILACALVGLLLVSVGVAGEGVFEALVTISDGELQTFNNMTLAEAFARASNAEVTASAFRSQIATAQAEAAASRQMAEEERLETARIRALIVSRTLTLERRKSIGAALAAFSKHFSGRKIGFIWLGTDPESAIFGVEIKDCLARAGIEAEPGGAIVDFNHLLSFGVHVTGPAGDEPFIRAFVDLFKSDTDGSFSGEWGPKYTNLMIDVGVKIPQGFDTLFAK